MNDVVEDCPECNNRECLKKIPSYFSIKNTLDDKKETGELVKESIEEFKEDLQNQKEKLKTEFIKHDE
jgi:gas vesicle protein